MAITNQERVGKVMELLRAGLAPFVDREFKSLHKLVAMRGSGLPGYELPAVQRALARQRPRGGLTPDQPPEQRSLAQPVVLIHVLIAERQPQHPLRDHRAERMLDALGRALIDQARGP